MDDIVPDIRECKVSMIFSDNTELKVLCWFNASEDIDLQIRERFRPIDNSYPHIVKMEWEFFDSEARAN